MFSFIVLFGVFITCEPAAAAASAVSAAGAALALVSVFCKAPALADFSCNLHTHVKLLLRCSEGCQGSAGTSASTLPVCGLRGTK
jgi:hypothetical protein